MCAAPLLLVLAGCQADTGGEYADRVEIRRTSYGVPHILADDLGAMAYGLAWAFVALLCEAAFTLLAVPVLGRLGPVGVSIHTCWIAALVLGALALAIDGAGALPPMPMVTSPSMARSTR